VTEGQPLRLRVTQTVATPFGTTIVTIEAANSLDLMRLLQARWVVLGGEPIVLPQATPSDQNLGQIVH